MPCETGHHGRLVRVKVLQSSKPQACLEPGLHLTSEMITFMVKIIRNNNYESPHNNLDTILRTYLSGCQ